MTRLASVVLGLSVWFGGALSAQQPGGPPSLEHQGRGWLAALASSDRPGAADTASETPEVQAATASFEALPALLTPGQKVNVRNTAGRATRGKVVSISDNQLVIARRRGPFAFFRRPEDVTFAVDVVGKIDIVDSTWDGAAIGTAAAIGLWRWTSKPIVGPRVMTTSGDLGDGRCLACCSYPLGWASVLG